MDNKKPEPAGVADEVLSVAEMGVVFSGPAIHVNKFYTTGISTGLRITFMEALLPAVPPQFRTAVILAYPDALALRDLLSHQLAEIEPQIRALEHRARAEASAKANAPTNPGPSDAA